MSPAVWNRIKDICADALDTPAEQRASFLASACGDDPQLRAQVDSLLAADSEAGEFLVGPTRDGSAQSLAGRLSEVRSIPAEQVGDEIGRYRLVEKLGEGGFGVVYRAEQSEPMRREVALKVIKLGMDTRRVVARFRAERQALALMDHPNIARVLDAGATDAGRPYFVMELVRGVPITRHCDERHLGIRERLALFLRVCSAVQHAHHKGIVHRDLKPSNVLVMAGRDGPEPKVIDFGVAKAMHAPLTDHTATQAWQFVGTPAYMSPEQAARESDIDTRSDIYSLGVLLYELLSGVSPFDPTRSPTIDYAEMIRRIRTVEPARPSTHRRELRGDPGRATRVPDELDWIVMKAIAKDRAHRYATASALAEDIERHLCDQPVVAGPPSTVYRLRKFAKRHQRLLAGTAASFGALGAGLVLALIAFAEAREERDTAERSRVAADLARQQAQAVSQFLQDMLTQADPARTEGRELSLRELLDDAAARIDTAAPDPPEVEATVRSTIGRTYSMIGRVEDAMPHLERALELHQQLDGENARETIRAQLDLANNLLLDGTLRPAQELLDESLAKLRAGTPNDAELLARHLYSLGRVMKREGDYAAAGAHLREAVDLFRGQPGFEGPLAQAIGELGVVLLRTADLIEAEALLHEALGLGRRVYGERSAHAAGLLTNLAVVVKRAGRLDEAAAMYREALDIQQATHGARHPATAGTLFNLGALLSGRRSFAEAEPLLTEAVELTRALHGEDSVQHAMALSTLGRTQQGVGQLDAAESTTRAALVAMRRAVDPRHEYVATSLIDLGSVQLARDDAPAAQESLQAALDIYRETLGDQHPHVGHAREWLGRVHYRRGAAALGSAEFANAIEIYRAAFGDPHIEVAGCYSLWATTVFETGDPVEAERLFREALARWETLGASDRVWADRSALGACLAAQERFEDAESVLLAVHESMNVNADAQTRHATLARIVALYESWGKPDLAAAWRTEFAPADDP